MTKIDYRSDIDGLRSIAILAVLLFHLEFTQITGGFVGVDIFFVISGFLITGIIKKEIEKTHKFNVKNFYLRRVQRLFPALFITLFFTTIFAILVFSPSSLSRFGGALTSSIFSVSNFYFWLEADYFDVSAKIKPLLHTWSLSVEEQFYFIWPMLLLLLMKMKNFLRPPFFLVLAGSISLYLNIIFVDGSVSIINHYFPMAVEWFKNGDSTIFFLLPFRMFEFAIGALVVWFLHYKSKQWVYDLLFLIGLIMIVYATFYFTDKIVFPSYNGLVPTIGTALLLYSGQFSRFNIVLTNPIAVGIGLISYSLYLVHWPIIVFWSYLADSIDLTDKFIILVISLALATLSYRYIEQPFRQKKIDITLSKWKYSSIIAVVILAYVGYNMKSNSGWTWRVDTQVVFEYMGDSSNFHRNFWGGAGYKGAGLIDKSNTKADIVLIGDSHGNHYAEGIYKGIAQPENKSLYVSTCVSTIYLPGFVRVNRLGYMTSSFEEDLPYIKNGNNPIVVLSADWLVQMSLADLVDENGTRKHVKVTEEDIIKGILALKQKIGTSTLVVIGNVPGARYNLYDIFSRPHTLIFSKFDSKKYTHVQADEKRMNFNAKLKSAAAVTGKFIFLDPHDVLCKDKVCRNLDAKGHLIYSDTDHLSKYGSIELVKGFLPVFKDILQKDGK